MTTTRILAQPPTARPLPPLLSAQERMARCCHDCGKEGKVWWSNKTILLCGECAVKRWKERRAC